MLWLTQVDQPGFMWCFALLYCQIKQMSGDANVRLQEGGSTEGKLHEKEEKKKLNFSFFFPFLLFFFF